MSDQSHTTDAPKAEPSVIERREHKDGVVEIYTNFIDIIWGFHDIRLRLARYLPLNSDYSSACPLRYVVEQNAAVLMGWAEAKLLRDILTDAIERYELANGELQWPKLPGQNLKESREQQLMASTPQGKAN